MSNKEIKIPVMYRRALLSPDTINEKNRTVDVVFATETPVLMRDWNISSRQDGFYWEILRCQKENVRMDRINTGAPLLDTHSRYSVKTDVLGVCENGRVENNQCIGTVRFSKRADVEPVFQDVKDKIIQNISNNYRVYQYDEVPMGTDEIPVMAAVDWEPTEISLVSVQADINSRVRDDNKENNQIVIINQKSREMTPEEQAAADAAAANVIIPAAPAAPAAAAAPIVVDAEKERSAATTQERTRVMEITTAVRSAKLDTAFAEKLIKDGITIEKSREMIIAEFAKRDPAEGSDNHVVMGKDKAHEHTREAIVDGLVNRANPGFTPDDKRVEGSRDFQNHSQVDIARHLLIEKGEKVNGLSPSETINRALGTTDYPSLLAAVVNKVLRTAYEIAPMSWKLIATQMNARDFKAMHAIQFGGNITLDKIGEDGEYKSAKLAESAETWSLDTYGKLINITRKALINDDLSGFSRVPFLFGQAACNNECKIMWGLIVDNGLMSDGKNVFHADHKNQKASSGAVPDLAGITAARTLIRRQTGLDGEPLNLMPKYLIGPPELETTILQLVSQAYMATGQGTINPYANVLTPIIEPRLSSAKIWYMAADKSAIDMLVYSYLEGQSGLFTEPRYGFDVDGIQIKVRTDFGGAIVDYRGLYYNKGEA